MWEYEKNHNNSARFILGEPGSKNLICIGVNPSTAEPENLDSTLINVKSISKKKGFTGWIMINLYPQRATNPNNLHDKIDENFHNENIEFLRNHFTESTPTHVWASWGVLIEKRTYLKSCLKDITDIINTYNPKWMTLGALTKDGHPHHPLYISHKTEFIGFDIINYLK